MRSGADGFTLLEVLLAMTVLGIVMTMLSLSLSGTIKVVDGTTRREEIDHQAQTALRRLSEDLAAAVQTKDIPFAGRKNARDTRRADSLVFVSQAHLDLSPEGQRPGLALLRYHLEVDPGNERNLRLLRSDTLLLPGQEFKGEEDLAPPFLLADHLSSFRITYLDAKGQETDSWGEAPQKKESDKETDKLDPLPGAVRCTLEFWLDAEESGVQTFSTAILIPGGAFVVEEGHAN